MPTTDKRTSSKEIGGDETILVCEDQEMVRRLECKILTQVGYSVIEAANGKHALQLAANHDGPIHLLITDLVMPQMNGRELAAAFKKDHPDMLVLFMSGYTSDVIDAEGVMADKLPFLEKPFELDELIQKVREILDKVKAH